MSCRKKTFDIMYEDFKAWIITVFLLIDRYVNIGFIIYDVSTYSTVLKVHCDTLSYFVVFQVR
jgi:hypothetical protein